MGDRDFFEKLKGTRIKGSTKDQPSYRMIQSVDDRTGIEGQPIPARSRENNFVEPQPIEGSF
jgi:hypothetical protein